MKLKYIFTALVAALTLAVGCEDDIETYLDEVRVSSSYVAIPAAGGSQTITVNAKSDWSFGDIPEWVKVSPDYRRCRRDRGYFQSRGDNRYERGYALSDLRWQISDYQRPSADQESGTRSYSVEGISCGGGRPYSLPHCRNHYSHPGDLAVLQERHSYNFG